MRDQEFYWIYMLRLSNGSYYTGYAKNLEERMRTHRSGRGAKITRSFAPVEVVACWKLYSDRSAAMGVEAWIKSRSRQAKQHLVDQPHILSELLRDSGREDPIEPLIPPPVFP